jgi:hypothetical protein
VYALLALRLERFKKLKERGFGPRSFGVLKNNEPEFLSQQNSMEFNMVLFLGKVVLLFLQLLLHPKKPTIPQQ